MGLRFGTTPETQCSSNSPSRFQSRAGKCKALLCFVAKKNESKEQERPRQRHDPCQNLPQANHPDLHYQRLASRAKNLVHPLRSSSYRARTAWMQWEYLGQTAPQRPALLPQTGAMSACARSASSVWLMPAAECLASPHARTSTSASKRVCQR